MLRTINLTKKYGAHTALDNLNLTVQAGEIFCLLGANGAGKTTTINLFMHFIQATSGQVFINDME
ncbi:MAG: ATP-binding cassette domain-containing protein, partial [Bacteroidota bacterium]